MIPANANWTFPEVLKDTLDDDGMPPNTPGVERLDRLAKSAVYEGLINTGSGPREKTYAEKHLDVHPETTLPPEPLKTHPMNSITPEVSINESVTLDDTPEIPLPPREGDQPLPEKNDSTPIQHLVIKDVLDRMDLGKRRYGTYLQSGNGRKTLIDAYEEALDLAIYLRLMVEDQKN